MVARRFLTAIALICCAGSWAPAADEVRYYEKDGVTYRETRRIERRPVVETRVEQSSQTVYREQEVTELRDTIRQQWTPITEYRWEAVWVNRWNPFAQPYLAYRYVGRTRWERSTETVKTPVVCRRLVPETRVVQVPVASQRIVEQEVISRVAVSGAPARQVPWTSPTYTARLVPVATDPGPIGGVARLESDPPRQSTGTAWRASGAVRR